VAAHAQDRRPPSGRPDLVHDGADHRRLPGAIRAQEPEHLTEPDIQIQVHQCVHGAVVLGQPLGLNRELVGDCVAPSIDAGGIDAGRTMRPSSREAWSAAS